MKTLDEKVQGDTTIKFIEIRKDAKQLKRYVVQLFLEGNLINMKKFYDPSIAREEYNTWLRKYL